MSRKRLQPPNVCPVCGYDVPRNALACPGCGADHKSGWQEEATCYNGVDLPDEEFDYDEFVRKEFGSSSVKPHGIKTIWWITAILIILVTIISYIVATYFQGNPLSR